MPNAARPPPCVATFTEMSPMEKNSPPAIPSETATVSNRRPAATTRNAAIAVPASQSSIASAEPASASAIATAVWAPMTRLPYAGAPVLRDHVRLPDERPRLGAHQGHARGARPGRGDGARGRRRRRHQHLHDPREAGYEAR